MAPGQSLTRFRAALALLAALSAALWGAAAPVSAQQVYPARGVLNVMDTSFGDGGHQSTVWLVVRAKGMFRLASAPEAPPGLLDDAVSGYVVSVASLQPPVPGQPWEIFTLEVLSAPPPPPELSPPPPSFSSFASEDDYGGEQAQGSGVQTRGANVGDWISNWNPGVILNQNVPDPPRVVRDLPSLFIILDLCDLGTATSEDALANVMFNGANPMSDYVATCSYGKAQFDSLNSRILTVKLPCSGVGPVTRTPWTSDSCSDDNLFNWMHEVEDYIDNELRPTDWNHRRYRHHILILPPNMLTWGGADCTWSGKGIVGMAQGSWSYAWISGDSWSLQQVYLHEMAHNYGLLHAATLEYGDPDKCSHCDYSSAMGFCCATRCMSAPHNYQLGWAKPAAMVNRTHLTSGNTLAFDLPSAIIVDANYLQVTTNWLSNVSVSSTVVGQYGGLPYYNPPNATFFLSYRRRFDVFDEVPDPFAGGTNIYLFTTNSQYDAKDSIHLGLIKDNQAWTDPSGTLVVRQMTSTDRSAIVTLCRPEPGPEASFEKCNDFDDNDCDGLIDADDPDCANFLSPPAPFRPPVPHKSPPPSPRPPRSPYPPRRPPPSKPPSPPRPPSPPHPAPTPRPPSTPTKPPPPRRSPSPPPAVTETSSGLKRPPPVRLRPPPPSRYPPPPPPSKRPRKKKARKPKAMKKRRGNRRAALESQRSVSDYEEN